MGALTGVPGAPRAPARARPEATAPHPHTHALASRAGAPAGARLMVHGVHHVALICADLEASLSFYCDVLGLEVNPDRPHHKLPYRGAWLWIGPEMIHLMELPNPDPAEPATRPQHGGRDRHFCIGVSSLGPLVEKLGAAGVPFTRSASGQAAVFFRDPDCNVVEAREGLEPWR
ncbi:MAG: Glyoxalase/Bleomycin resistance protein/Dihydroxybiphenyl dioxygenase [Monoraphidium minutum]|nr:MAG: Glyoxalase/Bleomycin resistance protein/Dihydroxybiphenyl dioxygenase [Monoraphidium minutum]